MEKPRLNPQRGIYEKLKLLMLFRVLFSSLLLGSTIILQLSNNSSPLARSLLVLYGLIVGIFLLSFVYAIILPRFSRHLLFAKAQIAVDTLIVTLILIVTGSLSSVFSYLYLVVIIYASMLLPRGGSLAMAALCSIQYGLMAGLEYNGVLKPFMAESSVAAMNSPWGQVFYKVFITMAACFAVGFLCDLLSEEARKSQKELTALEAHVKRVERLATMGEMAAGMAHEIKNPLASLAGSIQLLKDDLDVNPEREKLMQIVLRETDRLNSLLSNFLLFARPPAGRVETIALDRAMAEIISLFEKDGSCRGRVVINKRIDSDIWVEMDPVHLRQIVWNLLLNAAEAIEGAGTIDIEMVPLRHMKTGITISDSGCGIPDKLIDSIFDPFFTTKPDGTGLGLPMVHSILKSYDSRLDVESEVNKGTIFRLKMKRIIPPGEPAAL
jgi:two-component system, NtrC family, sensor histidine kinase HydH